MSGYVKRGFVWYDKASGRVKVDWRQMYSSIVAANILSRQIVACAPLARGTLLDVGCGCKPYLEAFRPFTTLYYGIDLPGSVYGTEAVDLFADGLVLPFKSETFDTVLCSEVLEHVPEPDRILDEIRRVLKPGGILILSAPQTFFLHEYPNDFYRYTKYGLLHLLQKHQFDVTHITCTGGIGAFTVDLLSKLLLFGVYICNALKYRLIHRSKRSLTEWSFVKWGIALPGRLFLTVYYLFCSAVSPRTVPNQWQRLVWEASELLTFGHVVVGKKRVGCC